MGQRDELRQPRLRPSIGAMLPAVDSDDQLENFSIGFEWAIRNELDLPQPYDNAPPKVAETDEVTEIMIAENGDMPPLPAEQKTLYSMHAYRADDIEDVHMTIAEKRWGDKRPNRRATYWTGRDIGRIVGEIQDEVARLPLDEIIDDEGCLQITFDAIKRVGGDGRRGRKIALVPEDSAGYELILRMHETVVEIIDRHHKAYSPPDSFIPHMTVGRFGRSIPEEKIGNAIEQAEKLLPITTNLGPIMFFDSQQITIRDPRK